MGSLKIEVFMRPLPQAVMGYAAATKNRV